MEVVLPSTITLTVGGIVAAFALYGSVIWAYFKLKASISELREDFHQMQKRNESADKEAKEVKLEQDQQRISMAVMAEQINNQSKLLERIDRNVEELSKRGRIE